ncbi:histidine phosphatase family protein [Sphaerisporangium corydalis]|uniref:Histidine phosphatase family protein n=1 Tax=Sphaerisporangium corydalis TaxID=1441875 RepID=A0ABV9E965_9ACTN|nr:histidine phosphatase family protein [Sphaerisporangium corydalis]
MTIRIVLICHGSTEALHRAAFPLDEELDDQGKRQVAARRGSMGDGAGRAVCGPSLRCRQTASGLGLAAEADEGLRDQDAGRWAGRALADVRAEDPDGVRAWLTDPAAAPSGGESLLALIERVAAWLDAPRDPGGGRLVAVTHAAVMRAAVVHALGTRPEMFWSLDVEPLSSVSLTGGNGRWRLRFPQTG